MAIVAMNENMPEADEKKPAKKRFYFLVRQGKLIGKAVPWILSGQLKLGVGSNRYLLHGDQAALHDYEKDCQCYYIYELREKEWRQDRGHLIVKAVSKSR